MQDEPVSLAPLLDALRELVTWFRDQKINGIVIGGVAASLLGRPRATRDIDALVLLEENKWPEFLEQGEKYNFSSRITEPLPFALKSRVLLLKHIPSAIDAILRQTV